MPPAAISVLGTANSPSQIAHALVLATTGAEPLLQVLCVVRDSEGHLSTFWDESHDTATLCEAATWLSLEAERCLVEEHGDEDD